MSETCGCRIASSPASCDPIRRGAPRSWKVTPAQLSQLLRLGLCEAAPDLDRVARVSRMPRRSEEPPERNAASDTGRSHRAVMPRSRARPMPRPTTTVRNGLDGDDHPVPIPPPRISPCGQHRRRRAGARFAQRRQLRTRMSATPRPAATVGVMPYWSQLTRKDREGRMPQEGAASRPWTINRTASWLTVERGRRP